LKIADELCERHYKIDQFNKPSKVYKVFNDSIELAAYRSNKSYRSIADYYANKSNKPNKSKKSNELRKRKLRMLLLQAIQYNFENLKY